MPSEAASRATPSRPTRPGRREFEERFPYEETADQLRCTEEIKSDMEKPVPMDRLLCGDVGYGKTEVALRAVMKCILDGKQGRDTRAHHGSWRSSTIRRRCRDSRDIP